MGNFACIWTLTICLLISANFFLEINGHHDHDHDHRQEYFGVTDATANFTTPSVPEQFGNETGVRNKRNAGANSPESLLASCQLTNLLLYQALQQQRQVNANPLLALATSNLQGLAGSNLNLNNLSPLGQQIGGGLVGGTGPGNFLNPLAAINQNLVYPSLTTYLTTSTFTTKMTTTALVTVPLLFGNKPFSTTITRTKTFDVTTSEIKTITSTVTPTLVVPQIKASPVAGDDVSVVVPTAIVGGGGSSKKEEIVVADNTGATNKNEYDAYEDDTQYHNDVQEETRAPSKKIYLRERGSPVDTDQFVSPSKPSKTSSSRGTTTFTNSADKKQRRKTRPTTTTESPPPPQRSPTKYAQKDAEITTKSKSQRQHGSQYQSPAATGQDEYDYYGSYYGNNPTQAPTTREKSKKKTSTAYGQQQPQVQQEQFYNRQYGSSIQEDDSPIEEDPAAVQYSDDYGYYNRRLKRGSRTGMKKRKMTRTQDWLESIY
ncbi:uncharacterized protein LOC110862947 [Folsomia candida]|uniref:uncharacterized protein LOC110862947 n=1 Tax=Folsomia candida TaxID=158441 RepID=UPI00160522A2|nr:uncharacterized protein LOC110862947 [Folsomia candida]